MDRIIVKPTDYIINEEGKVDYSYNYGNQYDDAKYLDSLTEKEIKLEIDRRWKDVLDLPVPSNISKHALARDLALAKGFDISKKPVSASKQTESQREF